ncbi:MAG: DNA mismatch repair protein MutS, partial [Spirochaetia bacterium]|nr:DNA mismatch repair protein MutS [Spirochaetia bacterium]
AAGSYGLHVAGLAGIPGQVLKRARELQERFASLEQKLAGSRDQGEADTDDKLQATKIPSPPPEALNKKNAWKAELFSAEDMAIARIRGLNPDEMTPLEALQLLSDLHKTLA